MSDHPTATSHEAEIDAYHDARLTKEREEAQEKLARHIAHHMYGVDMDRDTPEGWRRFNAEGVAQCRPLAAAVLSCPGITFTAPGEGQS